mmetsp:Transcript_422/g.930  ORF Transcript_422/g.930 Transcript_422/m.930 type:complete len:128 (-) Transcript_422:211-594(-)|eukprot:CAMPEP_0172620398 /NCGR_PEP_ID=MMETSP1068-20121228/103204_1 /TAXON_ID=35684 /ORGANISM="Pseudopedinella elastica, Strain CCMP716" /LENGTH=127 /DNA_ID=CAMNT_0013427637 /DNA_START=72 /DNA_END=455 /DNA_ORIENTATION=+
MAPELTSLKKRRRTAVDGLQGRLSQLSEDQASAEAQFSESQDRASTKYELILGGLEKSRGKLTDMKNKQVMLQNYFEEVSESEREKMTQYVLENIDIMTEKIQNIEEKTSAQKTGMLAQMMKLIGGK